MNPTDSLPLRQPIALGLAECSPRTRPRLGLHPHHTTQSRKISVEHNNQTILHPIKVLNLPGLRVRDVGSQAGELI